MALVLRPVSSIATPAVINAAVVSTAEDAAAAAAAVAGISTTIADEITAADLPALADAAVDADMVGKDVLAASDSRVPQIGAWPGVSASVLVGGHATFMTANDIDGAPVAQAAQLIATAVAPLLNIGQAGTKNPAPNVRGSAYAPVATDVVFDSVTGEMVAAQTNMLLWLMVGSSTASGLASRFATYATTKGATSSSQAFGGQLGVHSSARSNARPLIASASVNVPTTGTVQVSSTNVPTPFYVPFSAMAGYFDGHPERPGTLSTAAGNAASYTFTPTADGSAFTVAAGTKFISTDGLAARASFRLINYDKNGLTATSTAQDAFDRTLAEVKYGGGFKKRFIVMGHFADTNAAVDEVTKIKAYNALCAAAFGTNFIDLFAYLTSSQVWIDTGITPTTDDLAKQTAGQKPVSLSGGTGGSDTQHMSTAAYDAVHTNLIIPKINVIGGF